MNSARTLRRNEPSSIFVLLMQKYNVWLVFRNTIHWTEKFIVLIVAVMAPRCYRVRSSILNQSNWMTNKLCIYLESIRKLDMRGHSPEDESGGEINES